MVGLSNVKKSLKRIGGYKREYSSGLKVKKANNLLLIISHLKK